MEHNNYPLRRRPTPDLPRLTRRQQRLYERFDTLSDACWNLSQAISALSDCRSKWLRLDINMLCAGWKKQDLFRNCVWKETRSTRRIITTIFWIPITRIQNSEQIIRRWSGSWKEHSEFLKQDSSWARQIWSSVPETMALPRSRIRISKSRKSRMNEGSAVLSSKNSRPFLYSKKVLAFL